MVSPPDFPVVNYYFENLTVPSRDFLYHHDNYSPTAALNITVIVVYITRPLLRTLRESTVPKKRADRACYPCEHVKFR